MAKRLAKVDQTVCVACGECENVCPKGAIGVFKGMFAKVEESRCVGCALCGKNCPAGCIEVEAICNEEKMV